MRGVLPRSRRGRALLLAIVANEVRGLIVAGPALVALFKHLF